VNILPHGTEANYRLTIRTFPDTIEVTARPVNHQLELARSRSCGVRGTTYQTELPEEERALKDEENLTRSIRRAKTAVRWLVQRGQFDHMLTLTYRENMQDIDKLKHDFDLFRRLVTARYPDWKYVATREQQERGAWHMHLAVKGHQDIKYLRTCWYKVLGCLGAVGIDVLGQVNVMPPRKRFGEAGKLWKSNRLASYLTKYIDKGFDLLEHASKRYWASRGMPKVETKRYWLGSQNIVEFIKDTFDLAMMAGLEDFPSIMQSHDRTLIYMTGARNTKLSLANDIEF